LIKPSTMVTLGFNDNVEYIRNLWVILVMIINIDSDLTIFTFKTHLTILIPIWPFLNNKIIKRWFSVFIYHYIYINMFLSAILMQLITFYLIGNNLHICIFLPIWPFFSNIKKIIFLAIFVLTDDYIWLSGW
jgi:hypothetical protein